jgi:trimeric autotransporter adhesin
MSAHSVVIRPLLPFAARALAVIAALLLSACGGGEGAGSPSAAAPAAPALALTPQGIKTFAFTWADVAGETEYRLLENPDGTSGYTLVATLASNATSHNRTVFLPGRINARYILQACNTTGCTDSTPVLVSGTLAAAVGYVKASNTGPDDQFGLSIALSADGSTLAVGAYREASNATGIGGNANDNSAFDSGAVYVFARGIGSWAQQAYLKASNTGVSDRFGISVALSADGNTLAVGADLEASNATGVGGSQADDSAISSGAVYVFARSSGNWTQQAYVKASNTGPFDQFGRSVALSGDGSTLAVGADGEASNATGIGGNEADDSFSGSGAVYVFARSIGTWTQQAYVKASNTGGDGFGHSVALSGDGNTLAVGAPIEASNATGIGGNQADDSAFGSGAVYVFFRSAGAWAQQAYVKASNSEQNDFFGWSVAVAADGNTLAVGAFTEASSAIGIAGNPADNSAAGSGAVYVLTRSAGSWTQNAYVKAPNAGANDLFGSAVALSADGNTLAVGAPAESSSATGIGGDQTNNSASLSGAVYLY